MKKLLIATVALALGATLAYAHPVAPHLNANQKAYGCSILNGHIFCHSPGTGMCWKPRHNPNLGQPAESLDLDGAWGNPRPIRNAADPARTLN
jgi:hypothetical protein